MANRKGSISVTVATAVGLGAIIGAGIFVLSGSAIALAGADAIIAFILVGVIATFVALQIAELGSIMPTAQGASYSYVYNAFGSELGFITGVIFYFSSATAISAISLGFGAYLASMLGIASGYSIYLAVPLILALSVLTLFGMKKAANVDFLLVLIKMAVLSIFIIFAVYFAFGLGHFNISNFGISNAQSGIEPIAAASIAIFFAYSGFQTISTFTSDVKGGPRAAAKSIMLAVLLSLAVYVMIVISMMMLVPSSTYKVSTADPISLALSTISAPYALEIIVGIGALIATASASLAMMLRSSRIVYQLGKDGLLPKFLRKYDAVKDVSPNGVFVTVIIAVAALFAGNVYIIAAISAFGTLFTYLMSSFALIHFRRVRKPGSFKSPLYPYISIVSIIAILAFIYGMPQESLFIGIVLILVLIITYYFMREYDEKKVVKIRIFK